MPIIRGSADAVAITEAEVEVAPFKHCKGIIPRSGDVILGPALSVPIGGRVDQHQEAL